MTEIEKMKRYIARTKLNDNDRFCMFYPEAVELFQKAQESGYGLFEVISLAFDYGKAKGYRAAKAERRAST